MSECIGIPVEWSNPLTAVIATLLLALGFLGAVVISASTKRYPMYSKNRWINKAIQGVIFAAIGYSLIAVYVGMNALVKYLAGANMFVWFCPSQKMPIDYTFSRNLMSELEWLKVRYLATFLGIASMTIIGAFMHAANVSAPWGKESNVRFAAEFGAVWSVLFSIPVEIPYFEPLPGYTATLLNQATGNILPVVACWVFIAINLVLGILQFKAWRSEKGYT
jgi:hypothetical protein